MTDELPGAVQAELTRLRAERVAFTEERERLRTELRESELQVRELTKHRDRLVKDLEKLSGVTERAEQAETLAGDVLVARAERDALRTELAGTRTERDRLRLRLLDAELQLSSSALVEAPVAETGTVAAEQRAAELARALEATRATVSWRVTAPLRAVRKRTS
jgi:predicted  nucleic acid-binding Zn-ribbon protein